MKEWKEQLLRVRLSGEAKARILENVRKQRSSRLRLSRQTGLLAAACACVCLVLTAAVISTVSLRPETVRPSDASQGEAPNQRSLPPEESPLNGPACVPSESSPAPNDGLPAESFPASGSPTESTPKEPDNRLPEESSSGLSSLPSQNRLEGVNILLPEEVPTEEFAADEHRPDGYPEQIGSVLALKMSLSSDPLQVYPVIVYIRRAEAAEVTARIREAAEKLPAAVFSPVTLNGEPNEQYRFAHLTAGQIRLLSELGAKLSYVGTGNGDPKAIRWDTAEGIETYCELMGDMYVFQGENIRYAPDCVEG